jgi:hypothetical protein
MIAVAVVAVLTWCAVWCAKGVRARALLQAAHAEYRSIAALRRARKVTQVDCVYASMLLLAKEFALCHDKRARVEAFRGHLHRVSMLLEDERSKLDAGISNPADVAELAQAQERARDWLAAAQADGSGRAKLFADPRRNARFDRLTQSYAETARRPWLAVPPDPPPPK